MTPDRAKTLLLLGTTRCGSTIIEHVLGNIDGFFAAGEIHMMWRGLRRGFRCGCGEPLTRCTIWSRVLATALSGSSFDADEIERWRLAEVRMMHTPRLLMLQDRPETGRAALDRYLSLLARLYPAIATVTGARVIVDSSKTPAVGALLARLAEVDLYVLHVVRDPRGVAHSWRRGRPSTDGGAQQRTYSPGSFRTAGRWIATNALAEALRRRLPPGRSMMVRYEDFATTPKDVVRRIATFVGEGDARLPFVDERTASLQPTHTVSGNRSRFRTGPVELRLDDEWRNDPILPRAIVTGIAMPLLPRYGYPAFPAISPTPSR